MCRSNGSAALLALAPVLRFSLSPAAFRENGFFNGSNFAPDSLIGFEVNPTIVRICTASFQSFKVCLEVYEENGTFAVQQAGSMRLYVPVTLIMIA